MQKYEEIQTYASWKKVGVKKNNQDFYDLDIITASEKQRYFTLTEVELNTVLSALEILNKRKWGTLK